MKTQRIHHPTQFLSQARPSRPQLQLNHFHPYIQGDFFHWYPPISVPKRKPPSSQSRSFLVTGFTGTAAVIGLLEISFLALKLGGTSGKNHPVLAGYQDLCFGTAEDGDARKVRRQFGDHGTVAWKGWCRVYATLSTPFSLQVDANVMVVMDSFALPVEGTETRVNAQAQGYEYMTAYIESAKQVGTNM